MKDMSQPASVYFAYDIDGKPLYVGVTADIKKRIYQHSISSEWHPKLARLEVEDYGDRLAAECAERDAIIRLNPPYNKSVPAVRDDGATWHQQMSDGELRRWSSLDAKSERDRRALKDVRSEQEKIRQAVLYRVRKATAKENGDE